MKSLLQSIKHDAMVVLAWLIPSDKLYLRVLYRIKTGRTLRLDSRNEMRFTEKLQWLKLYNRHPEYMEYVDKSIVKEMVAKMSWGGGNYRHSWNIRSF